MMPPGARERFSGLHINRLIPNMLTVFALCAGLTAVLYGFNGRWHLAVLAVLLAAVLDALDGRLARLLGGASKFGAELDSLSDFVSFGVAPALLLFLWTLQEARGPGWVVALVFAVCAALRLARFNTRLVGTGHQPAWAGSFFTGVPAPAAGGLVLLPMILSFEFDPAFFSHPLVNAPVAIGVSYLMISRLPTFSFKQVKVPHRFVVPLLLLVGLTAALLVTATWATVAGLLIIYLLTIPFSVRAYRRLEAEEADMADADHGVHLLFEEIPDGEEGDMEDFDTDQGEILPPPARKETGRSRASTARRRPRRPRRTTKPKRE